jgi:hypothetical protein
MNQQLQAPPWQQIFQLNQLMFAIWDFIEFPSILCLSAVHSDWAKRLCPFRFQFKPPTRNRHSKCNNKQNSKWKRKLKLAKRKSRNEFKQSQIQSLEQYRKTAGSASAGTNLYRAIDYLRIIVKASFTSIFAIISCFIPFLIACLLKLY